MKKLTMGLLAHVDAGKTTLSEAMLYQSGVIRKLGRVDYKDAYLDTYEMERDRGITIFSKQAVFSLGDLQVTLLDTPGHVDFSAEMERTLQVLDYAILVINGADGVQGHTLTLWKLLGRYKIPVFLFINKMDQEGTDREALLRQLQTQLSEHCLDFSGCRLEGFPGKSGSLQRGGSGTLSGNRRDHPGGNSRPDPGAGGISLLFWFGAAADGSGGVPGGDAPFRQVPGLSSGISGPCV